MDGMTPEPTGFEDADRETLLFAIRVAQRDIVKKKAEVERLVTENTNLRVSLRTLLDRAEQMQGDAERARELLEGLR